MNKGEDKKQPPHRSLLDLPWAVIASTFGLLLLGVAYSLGDAYYRAYLRVFAVDGDAFPMDHPRHLVLALWGSLNAWPGFLNWLSHNGHQFLVLVAVLLAGGGVIVLMDKWLSSNPTTLQDGANRFQRYVQRSPYFDKYLSYVFWVWIAVFLIFLASLMLTMTASIPSVIGEAAGQSVATADRKDFDKGCEKSAVKCYSVTKGEKEIARGYVVAQSSDRIALYYMGVTTQVPLSDTLMKTLGTQVAR